MLSKKPIITLLTDFGLHDYFVGVLKGVILNIQPEANIVDISHSVPPHNIFHAAFLIRNYYPYFPHGTIHVVVVDPGVGTQRRPIVASTEKGCFIAPDNGVLSYLYAGELVREVREITADHYFMKPRSATFDGRDVFAPVAAWIAKGVDLSSFGEPISDYKKFDVPQPLHVQPGAWKCKIIHVDRFGNLISNLQKEQFTDILNASEQRRFAFRIGEHTISKMSQSYADGNKDEVTAVFGSSDLLEFCVNQGSASAVTDIRAGRDFLVKIV